MWETRNNVLCRLLMPPDEYASYKEDEIVDDNVSLPCPPTLVQGDKSKWSLYMSPKEDTVVNYFGCRILKLHFMFWLGRRR